MNQANALAFWDCLQRYMDISQPQSDLPVLEQSRHLDPALSIEAYYRAQEAKGIQATPKADDFDNVHRR